MPKQTIEFIKNISVFGLTHGCDHNIMENEKSGLYNDKAYVESLIRTGQTIRSDLKKTSIRSKNCLKPRPQKISH